MSNKSQESILKSKDRTVFDSIIKMLFKHGKVKVTGFGTFEIKRMRARKGYNPHTKHHETLPAYNKLVFTPTKSFKEAITSYVY